MDTLPAMKLKKPKQLVLVQAIVSRWTKASRGAPGASVRNRVPEVFALPADSPDIKRTSYSQLPEILPRSEPVDNRAPDLFLHLVSYGERNHFQEPVAQYWTTLTTRLPDESALQLSRGHVPLFLLTRMDVGLQVRFSWHEIQGAPSRHHRHIWEQAVLTPGQWMQVRFNARYLFFEGDWYYEKHVINIGVVDAFTPSLFVNGSPGHRFSDMANLH